MAADTLSGRIFNDDDSAPIDPFALFEDWFAAARASEPNDPHAMALASVDKTGLPDVRMVLMNARDHRGFVFFTNFDSRKGEELLAHPKAALVFHWKSLRRQVRARGPVEVVAPEEADAYFATRSRTSQLGANASRQSQPLASRAELMQAVERVRAGIGDDNPVPRPRHWSGFRIIPTEIEFWQDGEFRLHDRVRFTRADSIGPWTRQRLYP
ncbi:MAG: pyridoxamine 5'-phosphate oxidase [Devosia sp. 67-54]|uniref:pyridoxamine 5'-phosphate oxidase n=1 Tax=unclassified Devosia TaxID=196773 RepID=UPI000965D952|nr:MULTISPECIES: pyridoxamine 5'-phosphate oxidase [unclassified Devosia]MBN9305434.1 pyridoxamine 5'-phosphate oxidase [Devosia sp.]OJX19023.1 MAG: pyridoxamine 5'-phosphate oxidase [Devosia sp. 67-54]